MTYHLSFKSISKFDLMRVFYENWRLIGKGRITEKKKWPRFCRCKLIYQR